MVRSRYNTAVVSICLKCPRNKNIDQVRYPTGLMKVLRVVRITPSYFCYQHTFGNKQRCVTMIVTIAVCDVSIL